MCKTPKHKMKGRILEAVHWSRVLRDLAERRLILLRFSFFGLERKSNPGRPAETFLIEPLGCAAMVTHYNN